MFKCYSREFASKPFVHLNHVNIFVPGFTMQKLHNRTLHLHVFDYDRFSRDDSIGETYIELNNVSVPCRNYKCRHVYKIILYYIMQWKKKKKYYSRALIGTTQSLIFS